tara:strand:+ start:458 stop:901 length:444 start_codon:yes stop_codon:yes gene_type:complete
MRKNESKVMKKKGGARSAVLPTQTKKNLNDRLGNLMMKLSSVKDARNGFRSQRDIYFDELMQLKEENKILKKDNQKLNFQLLELKSHSSLLTRKINELENKNKVINISQDEKERNIEESPIMNQNMIDVLTHLNPNWSPSNINNYKI